MAQHPIITLTTDFGSNDHFVGVLKGVILDIVPEAQIVDICHSVQALRCAGWRADYFAGVFLLP